MDLASGAVLFGSYRSVPGSKLRVTSGRETLRPGAARSTLNVRVTDDTLPARSTAVTVITCWPEDKWATSIDHCAPGITDMPMPEFTMVVTMPEPSVVEPAMTAVEV